MLLAASPAVPRNLSSLIALRAKPPILYRGPSELLIARSYIAGIPLRFAQSPEAPNSTTRHGSLTLAPQLLAGLASTSISSNVAVLFIPSPVHDTIPQHRNFSVPPAVVPRSDNESFSSPASLDSPNSAAGHR